MASNFDRMAEERERYAATLSDIEIFRSIILKVIQLEIEPDMKVDILMQSITDIGTIFGQLKYYNNKGVLPNKEYFELLELFIAKYEKTREFIDFDPTKYRED